MHKIVAVTSDESGKHFLDILETSSGNIIKKINNPDQGYYLTPSWSDESNLIVVKIKNQQNSILRINVNTNKIEVLFPYSYEHRNNPRIYKDYLLYNSSYNGIDNIYAMHLPTRACFQITSSKYGSYLGTVDHTTNQLIFNDYTKNGMDIMVMPFDPFLWTPLDKVEDRSTRYYDTLVIQENNSDLLSTVTNNLYPINKYCYLRDSLVFIGPNVVPNWNDRGIYIEPFSLVNLQQTLKFTPYFYQNANVCNIHRKSDYRSTEIGLKIQLRTIYPVIKANINTTRYKHTVDKKIYINFLGKYINPYIYKTYWKTGLDIKIKFPYYFTLSSSEGKISFSVTTHVAKCEKKINHIIVYHFNIKNYSTASKKDFYSPYSQESSISIIDMKKNNDKTFENSIHFINRFYFPGIIDQHYFSFQPKIIRNKFKKVYFWKQYLALTYGFPLLYPEVGIPLIWFLQKVWIEAYYNYHYNFFYTKKVYFIVDHMPDCTIGVTFNFMSRFLSDTTLPHLKFSINFDFLKKNNDQWLLYFAYNFKFDFNIFSADKSK